MARVDLTGEAGGDPPANGEAEGSALALVPEPKQQKIDGMPVTQHKVQITGGITVSSELLASWKLGKPIELTVVGHIDSRKDKVITNYGEPTGEVKRQIVLAVHDLKTDDE